jgi:hypothetical protein
MDLSRLVCMDSIPSSALLHRLSNQLFIFIIMGYCTLEKSLHRPSRDSQISTRMVQKRNAFPIILELRRTFLDKMCCRDIHFLICEIQFVVGDKMESNAKSVSSSPK